MTTSVYLPAASPKGTVLSAKFSVAGAQEGETALLPERRKGSNVRGSAVRVAGDGAGTEGPCGRKDRLQGPWAIPE